MRREHGFFEESDNGLPSRRARSAWNYLGALGLLAGGACGAVGIQSLSDKSTHAQPLEVSLQRVVEIRSNGNASQAQLSAHLLNILNRTQEGVAQIAEASRGNDATAEWARRALAAIRKSAEDPGGN